MRRKLPAEQSSLNDVDQGRGKGTNGGNFHLQGREAIFRMTFTPSSLSRYKGPGIKVSFFNASECTISPPSSFLGWPSQTDSSFKVSLFSTPHFAVAGSESLACGLRWENVTKLFWGRRDLSPKSKSEPQSQFQLCSFSSLSLL